MFHVTSPAAETRPRGLLFELIDATERDEDGAVTARKVRVVASTIDGELPADMTALDSPVFTLEVSGSGEVYAQVAFDAATGERSAHVIAADTVTPASTGSVKYRKIGGFAVPESDAAPVTVNNVEYGPFYSSACPNWFTYPRTYGFSWLPPGGGE
jgi:hypothetical protein